MRVLISSRWIGGVGGVERHVASTIRALELDRVDVCAGSVIKSDFMVYPANGRVLARSRWWRPGGHRKILSRLWPAIHPLIKYRPRPYDVYLQFFHGPFVGDQFASRVRMLLPNGNDVRTIEKQFDLVLMEAPDNARLVGDRSRAIVLPPPVMPTSAHSEPVGGLPAQFLLTVFNPYGEVKGGDVMLATASKSPLPIVWCFSRRTLQFEPGDFAHRNIIPLENVNQAQLRFLYERCAAYVSFSRAEGFGWAIADALQYGAPIVSRAVGVLTIQGLDLREVYTYEGQDELVAALNSVVPLRVKRDLDVLGPEAFRAGLRRLAEAAA